MTQGMWIGEKFVYPEDLVYDVEHRGEVVASFRTEDEVWRFYFAKEREVKIAKGGAWDYMAIGIGGLVMFDWSKPETEKHKLRWETVYRERRQDEPRLESRKGSNGPR